MTAEYNGVMGTAPSPNRGGAAPPPISPGRGFIERITDGLKAEQLWAQFKADATSGYSLYKAELAPVEGGRRHRTWETIKQFFWAVMRKLTPVRRIMLLIGIFLTIFPVIQYQSGDQQVSISLNLFGALILVGLLILEVGDRVTMKRDLEIAREIQMWLVPDAPPKVAGLDIAFVNRPQNTVAGDYYDVLLRDRGARALLVVADVAGKSIPAGLLMATFQASLKTLLNHTSSITEIVTGVNEYACAHSNSGRRFTTAFLGEYEPASRKLTYVNAGHNAPILLRADGRTERLDRGGLPFGIDSRAPYDTGAVDLGFGDLLLIFTDGLVEAVNERGDEYGEPRLLSVVPALRPYKAKDAITALMNELNRFTGMAHQHDDITCLLVRTE
ncbi:MAG: PP2C family protein-serine/threonine phosphatase [Terriglobia bacterium]|nr:PP2C family protein-serine/threonine phosphatase [Terriglobia bacterium]